MFDCISPPAERFGQRKFRYIKVYHHMLTRPQYKRFRKSSSEPLDDRKRSFITSLLGVILNKLKWEEDADPEDMDEDDKAAFEELRKVRTI